MIRQTFPVGKMKCNCSIVVCPKTREAIVVDPGGDAETILAKLKELGAIVKLILITHAHFDHVLAARAVKAATGAPICLHKKDIWLYRLMPLQYRMIGNKDKVPPRPDKLLLDGDALSAGALSLSVLHTPGHSPGSCCFHLADEKLLFSGDTLFASSVGNWRFLGGSFEAIIRSVNEKLMVLPDDTDVVPGHGPETTIGFERKNNPYLQPESLAEIKLAESKKPGKLKMLGLMILAMFGF